MLGLPGGAYPGQAYFPLTSSTGASITQVVVETVTLPTPSASITQLAVETITLPTPAARVTQLVIETLASNALVIQGPGALAIQHPLLNGAGSVQLVIQGSGGVVVRHPLLNGAGRQVVAGSGSLAIQHPLLNGSGSGLLITASGGVVFTHPVLDGAGVVQEPIFAASGGVVFRVPVLAAAGTVGGSLGAITFRVPRLAGVAAVTNPSPSPPHPSYGVREKGIRRERIAPHLTNDALEVFFPAIQIEVRPGIGKRLEPGRHPTLFLSLSHDGGFTWSRAVAMTAGDLGDFTARMIARQLGFGRDLVFRVWVSDPNTWDLVGAYFDPDPVRGLH